MSDSQWQQILQEWGAGEAYIHSRYDCIIHLSTAADGALNRFKNSNESAEEACFIDKKIQDAWKYHENFNPYSNANGWSEKLKNAARHVVDSASNNLTVGKKRNRRGM